MKKSEAIKLIQDTFEFQGLGTTMRYKDAEAILSALLEAGMLPPKIQGKYDPVPTVTPTGNLDYGVGTRMGRMKKVYFRPHHIVDTSVVVFKLNEDILTIERFSPLFSLAYHLPSNLDGFDEVNAEEFIELCNSQASKESVESFCAEYEKRFSFPAYFLKK